MLCGLKLATGNLFSVGLSFGTVQNRAVAKKYLSGRLIQKSSRLLNGLCTLDLVSVLNVWN